MRVRQEAVGPRNVSDKTQKCMEALQQVFLLLQRLVEVGDRNQRIRLVYNIRNRLEYFEAEAFLLLTFAEGERSRIGEDLGWVVGGTEDEMTRANLSLEVSLVLVDEYLDVVRRLHQDFQGCRTALNKFTRQHRVPIPS